LPYVLFLQNVTVSFMFCNINLMLTIFENR
jgi:hypothetical protein